MILVFHFKVFHTEINCFYLIKVNFREKDLRSLPHLDEKDSPELCPALRLSQGAVARQVGPFAGDDGVSDAHQHHAEREVEDVGGGQQEEG